VAESVPVNTSANEYVPSEAELAQFRSELGEEEPYPYSKYVTGNTHLSHPSTDDIIQWAAAKWGIPADWLRAESVQESDWNQLGAGSTGDARTYESSSGLSEEAWYKAFLCTAPGSPAPCSIKPPDGKGGAEVYTSLGIIQEKWLPGKSQAGWKGVEPLRWKSTAFNLDFRCAILRYYFDGLVTWETSNYHAGEAWPSLSGWFESYPWRNAGQEQYTREVQEHLARRDWP
jgi:hypothetical protein